MWYYLSHLRQAITLYETIDQSAKSKSNFMFSKTDTQRIAEIEGALMNIWTTDNNLISFDFMPSVEPGEIGKVEIGDANLIISDTLDFKVSLENNDPYITIVNPKLDQTKKYKILLIDMRKRVLNLLSDSGKELNFHLK